MFSGNWALKHFFVLYKFFVGLGTGVYPSHDPWGRAFSKEYDKRRFQLSGQRIAGQYVGILDGVQGDQDYIRVMFKPSRSLVNSNFVTYILLFFSVVMGPSKRDPKRMPQNEFRIYIFL